MLVIGLAAFAVPALAEPLPAGAPSSEILLFGASWCLPCRVELRDLERLSRRAAPDRITIAWIDRAPAVPASVSRTVRVLPASEARAIFRQVPSGGLGVPVTAMTDAAGRICAVVPDTLSDRSLERLRALCARR